MTPVYPSSSAAAANPLLGFSVDRTGGPSKWREADAEEEDEEEESLRPELLLYTNIKLAAVVMRMMPPTPWHWRTHMGQGKKKKKKKVQTDHKKQHGASDEDNCVAANWMQQNSKRCFSSL